MGPLTPLSGLDSVPALLKHSDRLARLKSQRCAAVLFDHFLCSRKNLRRNGYPELFGGL